MVMTESEWRETREAGKRISDSFTAGISTAESNLAAVRALLESCTDDDFGDGHLSVTDWQFYEDEFLGRLQEILGK